MKSFFVPPAICCVLAVHALGQWYPHVSAYRCADDSLVARLEFRTSTLARPVLWDSYNNRMYIFNDGVLYALDCSTDALVDSEWVNLWFATPALDAADRRLYCQSDEWVYVYDCVAESIVARIALTGYARHMVWSATQNKVYLSYDFGRTAITVIDCRTNAIVRHIPVVGGAGDMCLRGSGDKLYFAGDNSVGIVNVATDSLMRVIHLPDNVRWLAVNPLTDRLLVHDNYWTFVMDCAGDTFVDSLPHRFADFGALDCRTNRLYVFLDGKLCPIDLETGLILDSLVTGRANTMALDTTDDKAYAIFDPFLGDGDTLWVAGIDSGLVRLLLLPDYGASGVVWNPLMNKVYVGGVNPPPGVEETGQDARRPLTGGPTMLSAADVRSLSSKVFYDAMGRRVTNPRTGVYFIREEPQALRKVVIQH